MTCQNCEHNHADANPHYCIARLQEKIEIMERVRDTHLSFIDRQSKMIADRDALIEALQAKLRNIDNVIRGEVRI